MANPILVNRYNKFLHSISIELIPVEKASWDERLQTWQKDEPDFRSLTYRLGYETFDRPHFLNREGDFLQSSVRKPDVQASFVRTNYHKTFGPNGQEGFFVDITSNSSNDTLIIGFPIVDLDEKISQPSVIFSGLGIPVPACSGCDLKNKIGVQLQKDFLMYRGTMLHTLQYACNLSVNSR